MSADVSVTAPARPHPFASLTPRDYVTDAVAVVLLLVSLGLPWATKGNTLLAATDVAWVLPVTLLSVLSVTLPYLARFGAVPATWTVHSTRRARLVANAPYAIAVLAQYVLDGADLGGYRGVGTAAALGLAGAALAASPRAGELGPATSDRAVTDLWWRIAGVLGALIALGMVVWAAIFTAGFFGLDESVRDSLGGFKFFAVRIGEFLVVGALVLIPVVRVLVGRTAAWRGTAVAWGIALGVVFFLGGEDGSTQTALETLRSISGDHIMALTGAGLLLVPAFAAVICGPAVSRALRPTHPVTSWLTTANAALNFTVVISAALILIAGLAIVDGLPLGTGITAIVLLGIVAVMASIADRAMRRNIANGRRVALAVVALIALTGIVFLSVLTLPSLIIWAGTDRGITWAQVALAFGMPLLIIIALTGPHQVREFFANNPPSRLGGRESAYEWSPRTAAPVHAPSVQGQQRPYPPHPSQPNTGLSTGQSSPDQQSAAYDRAGAQAQAALLTGPQPTAPLTEQVPPVRQQAGHTPLTQAQAQRTQESSAAQPQRTSVLSQGGDAASTESQRSADQPEAGFRETDRLDVSDIASGFTPEMAADPATPAAVLAQIVEQAPHLRPQVAGNPSTYPALVEWLRELGEPDVDEALRNRQ